MHDPLSIDGGRSILLVENDPEIRELMRAVLETEGYDVTTAANGKEALERLSDLGKKRKPSLILLDLVLPIMTGWKFLQEKKSEKEWEAIPVVVISATPLNQQLPQGSQGYIRKPFDLSNLVQTVNDYCRPAPQDRVIH